MGLCTALTIPGCSGDSADAFAGGDGGIPGASGGTGAGDGGEAPDGAGTEGELPPPEMEDEGNFRVPRASGRFVYSASETTDSVAVIDSATLAIEVVGVGRGPTVVAPLSTEGSVAVLDQGSDDVALLRTDEDGETTVQIVPSSPGANNLAISPNGQLIYVYHDVDGPEQQGPGSDQELTVIDTTNDAVYEMTVGAHPRDVVFRADSSVAYMVTDDGVNVIPTADLPMIGLPDLLPVVDDPAIDPSTLEIHVAANQATALARIDGEALLYATDLTTGEQFDFALPGPPTDIDISADGTFAVATLPSLAGSGFVEISLPIGAGPDPVEHDVDGEYVGLAHLSPDGETMLLYTTVDPFGSSEMGRAPGYTHQDAAFGGGGSTTTGDPSGSSSDDGTTSGDDGPPDDSAGVDPDVDPRQRVTIARRGSGDWLERITLFVDQPVVSVGMAPDGDNAMLIHGMADAGSAPWSYTLLDLTKEFPVKKLQMVEAEPSAVLFTPDGDQAVVLLRDDMTGVRRVDLVDLRSFIVDALGLGSPPEGAGYVEATEKIFVSQEHPTGRITFLDREGTVETVTGYRLNDAVKD